MHCMSTLLWLVASLAKSCGLITKWRLELEVSEDRGATKISQLPSTKEINRDSAVYELRPPFPKDGVQTQEERNWCSKSFVSQSRLRHRSYRYLC